MNLDLPRKAFLYARSIMRITNASPQQPDHGEIEQAYRLLADGRLRESAAIAEALVKRFTGCAHVWHLVGAIYRRADQHTRALKSSQKAVHLEPDVATFQIQYGQCLVALGNRREALESAHRARAMTLATADDHDQIGTLFSLCDDPSEALPHFQAATHMVSGNTRYLYNLATAQRMLGCFVEAEATLDHVLRLDPSHGAAHYLRSHLRRQTPIDNHVTALSAQLGKATVQTESIFLEFALAKELEDLGRDELAVQHLNRGNLVMRRTLRYDVQRDVLRMEQIRSVYTPSAVSGCSGHPSQEPIFIFGLPRSGTTLLEKIVTSHSAVLAGGELPALPHVLSRALDSRNAGTTADPVVSALHLNAADLGCAYIEATRPRSAGKPHFTDKLPINYLHAGLISRALPNARMIALTRNPIDVCYAMYRTLFASGHYFTYDLRELAQYYAAWYGLMQHWRHVLRERLLIISYEDLVSAPQRTVRSLLVHCGLPWEDACLRFFEQPSPVMTASAAQVRQHLYSTSIGRWRSVAESLDPLIKSLELLAPPDGWNLKSSSDD